MILLLKSFTFRGKDSIFSSLVKVGIPSSRFSKSNFHTNIHFNELGNLF